VREWLAEGDRAIATAIDLLKQSHQDAGVDPGDGRQYSG
jgi:hypothetical protein